MPMRKAGRSRVRKGRKTVGLKRSYKSKKSYTKRPRTARKRSYKRTASRARPLRTMAAKPRVVHPFLLACRNPFHPSLQSGAGVRIPDDTAAPTFCLTQTSSCILTIATKSDATPSVKKNYIGGFALRPSMGDHTIFAPGSTTYDLQPDNVLPLESQVDSAGTRSYNWETSGSSLPGFSSTANYQWGPTAASTGSNYPLQWIKGVTNYAVNQGVRARPVAWGIKLRFAGLSSALNASTDPYGVIYFGVRNTENAESQAPQTDLMTNANFIDALDTAPFYDSGPGSYLDVSKLDNDTQKKLVGSLTLQQLRMMPDGIVIAAGPMGPEDRAFRDVDYWTGARRAFSDGTNIINPGAFDMTGASPWFVATGCDNSVFKVEVICHWEVVPETSAYTLPGTLRAEIANQTTLDVASRILSENPTAAGHASSTINGFLGAGVMAGMGAAAMFM